MSVDQSTPSFVRYFCILLIVLGVAGKFYGLTDPWKTHDHYNFGGVRTTAYTECLKSTPLSVSKGVPHHNCARGEPVYYKAHPPSLLFALWGWTSLFGSAEWSYRLFMIAISTLNIFLVFRTARIIRPEGNFAWLAAAFQSAFLGGLYFGSHLDFIGEFSVVFVLIATMFALRGRMTSACLATLVGGLASWPVYIFFGPLWLYSLLIGKGRKRVFAFGIVGFGVAVATMMWLHQTTDIAEFLRSKLLSPGYIKKEEKGLLEPFRWFGNLLRSHSRLLGPLFATIAFYELTRGEGLSFWTGLKNRWKSLTPLHHAVLLTSGMGFAYAIIGHEYVMVHVFLYLFTLPGLALLSANFVERLLATNSLSSTTQLSLPKKADRIWLAFLGVVFMAAYPYGIFKTNTAHDAFNSVLMILTVLGFLILSNRKQISSQTMAVFMTLGFLANFSQMVNYRNEPDTEKSFCEAARRMYQRTGQPVHTTEPYSDAKWMVYCLDVPVIFEQKPN